MTDHRWQSGALVMVALLAGAGVAQAQAGPPRSWRVPQDRPTIQAAVDAAAAGDEILVAAGRHCGAELRRPVRLKAVGPAGQTIIAGCEQSPTLHQVLRIGFFLPGTPGAGPARGTSIQGFSFDGAGVSNDDLRPLAFGVYARFTDDVELVDNHFQGTVQAITNTAGDGWIIRENRIDGLTLFDCRQQCGGGVGIAVQAAVGPEAASGGDADPLNRPERTVIRHNQVTGQAPRGFTTFPLVGVLVVSADATLVLSNVLAIQPGADAAAGHPLAAGVMVTDRCCGRTPLTDGARLSAAVLNDGPNSQYAVVVEGEGGANTSGLLVSGNKGQVLVEGLTDSPLVPSAPDKPAAPTTPTP